MHAHPLCARTHANAWHIRFEGIRGIVRQVLRRKRARMQHSRPRSSLEYALLSGISHRCPRAFSQLAAKRRVDVHDALCAKGEDGYLNDNELACYKAVYEGAKAPASGGVAESQ